MPSQTSPADTALDTVVVPRTADLGDGFTVKRVLPSSRRRMVGPFIFLDQMGPTVLQAGHGLDVRPHPHIGLAAVTYLFAGELLHRDSLGVVQTIRSGEVNWMTAGSGIAHSERSPQPQRTGGHELFGIQTWLALPHASEELAPSFVHHDADALPTMEGDGVRIRLIAGTLLGKRSPVQTASELVYADVLMEPGARLEIPAEHEERGIFIVEDTLELGDGARHVEGELLVLKPGAPVVVGAPASHATRVMLLGGPAMDGPRHVWWNFVSSSKERIEQAKEDWREGRFAAVPGETEFIPLPEKQPATVVNYP